MKRAALTAGCLLVTVLAGLYGIFCTVVALVFGDFTGLAVGVLALLLSLMGIYGAVRLNQRTRA